MSAKAAEKAVKAAQQRTLERALREERLALAAIVKVMLIEVPDPGRVLARLEAMTRAAEANPKTPAAIRRQLIDAVRFVRTAIERETGRPQTLFDPHVGHVKPGDVDRLANPTEGPQQLGLVNNDEIGDVAAAHEERVDTITKIHAALVELLHVGPADDHVLHHRYAVAIMQGEQLPRQNLTATRERLRELSAAGRIVNQGGEWMLIERSAA